MLGPFLGDIVGSTRERGTLKTVSFPLFEAGSSFTDDTVLTVATMDALLEGGDFGRAYHAYGNRFPDAGYGFNFRQWLDDPAATQYGSFGNGSAMRVVPAGYAFRDSEGVLAAARASAMATHDHPEGIKGAQAVALAVFLARSGRAKSEIRGELSERFAYDLSHSVDEIRPTYRFDVTCAGSVPQAITAFLEATGTEHAIRLAVSLGGDSDTLACIAGGIAEAFHGDLSAHLVREVRARLPEEFVEVIDRFAVRFEDSNAPGS
jgi:ADP-ribosylglycohydrolase